MVRPKLPPSRHDKESTMNEAGPLPPFPLDDDVLERPSEALNTCYGEMCEDGTHELVGGEFTLTQLLEFYSGYDRSKEIDLGLHPDPLGMGELVRWTEYPDAVYHE